MATWNTDKPAVGNTIAADIPDIEENFQELHDAIQAFTNGTFGTTTAADFKVDVLADAATMTSPVVTTGFNDGTQAISWPTNAMAAAKFMLGNSSTIAWFYLNTAPPGWKALTTGADKILAVAGGAGAYNVNGGNVAGTSFDDLEAHTHTGPSHTHTGPSHAHTIAHTHDLATGTDWIKGGDGGENNTSNTTGAVSSANSGAGGTGATGASGTGATAASSLTEARPTAVVGKLFQLDTA